MVDGFGRQTNGKTQNYYFNVNGVLLGRLLIIAAVSFVESHRNSNS
jgi:hypothetical protein